jgi:hypothetical protein
MPNIQAKVAMDKENHPGDFCPTRRCLWRTGGGSCPRHAAENERIAEMIRKDRLARAEAIGRTIRPNYTGD